MDNWINILNFGAVQLDCSRITISNKTWIAVDSLVITDLFESTGK